jgi:signal peptidase I
MIRLLRVTGNSLAPTYEEGDFVVIATIPFLFGGIRPGDMVVFRHRAYGTMIKQAQRILPDADEIHVMGTRIDSVDSRNFGPISKRDVLGKVVWHIKKPRGSS